MSPVSLVLEYWSALVYQLNQPPVFRAAGRAALVREGLVADDVDLLDLGDVALVHGKGDVDAVTLDRRDGGGDLHAVQAVRQVLALEFLLGAVDGRLVEDLGFADADFLQRLDQHVFSNSLVPVNSTDGDGRTFLDQHHQHIAFDFQRTSLKKPVAYSALMAAILLVVERLADPHRQVG
jgi:hypothetical protein